MEKAGQSWRESSQEGLGSQLETGFSLIPEGKTADKGLVRTDPRGGRELGFSPPLTGLGSAGAVGTGVCGLQVLLAERRSPEDGWWGRR